MQDSPESPKTAREATVPFSVGETLTYDVMWSTSLVAGSAVVRVVERRPSLGSTAYYIVAEGRPAQLLASLYNLYYKMDTLLETFTLLPQRTSLYSEEGSNRRTAVTRFDRPARKAFFDVQDEAPLQAAVDIPLQTQDGLSALYVLRTMTFRTGDTFTLPVLDEGLLYNLRMAVGASEPVRVPLGQVTAWNVTVSISDSEGRPVGSDAAVWISTDARRLPVRLQAKLAVGDFVLALREAQ